jgi:hypothetical protein
VRWIAIATLLAGCDVIWRLDHLKADARLAGDGTPIDTDRSEPPPAFCQDSQLYDDMSGNEICRWGAQISPSMLSQHDGVLDLDINGKSTDMAGCTAYGPYSPLTANGVFLHIPTTLGLPSAYTKLEVRNAFMTLPVASAQLVYDTSSTRLIVNDLAVATRSGAPPSWWRIRTAQGQFVADFSEDGITWMQFAASGGTLPSQIAVDFGAGITSTPSAPGKAVIAAFGICN